MLPRVTSRYGRLWPWYAATLRATSKASLKEDSLSEKILPAHRLTWELFCRNLNIAMWDTLSKNALSNSPFCFWLKGNLCTIYNIDRPLCLDLVKNDVRSDCCCLVSLLTDDCRSSNTMSFCPSCSLLSCSNSGAY